MTEDECLAEVRKHAENCCLETRSGVLCQYHLGMVDGVTVTYALTAVDTALRKHWACSTGSDG